MASDFPVLLVIGIGSMWALYLERYSLQVDHFILDFSATLFKRGKTVGIQAQMIPRLTSATL
jgi:hypothetical protein